MENENALDSIQNGHDSPTISANESENNSQNHGNQVKSNIEETVLSTFNSVSILAELNFFNSNMVSEMMMYFAEQVS